DAVMRTARRARPSIADRGQDDVVLGNDLGEERRIGVLREAFLLVVMNHRETVLLAEPVGGLAQQPVGVPFRVVEDAEPQAFEGWGARCRRNALDIDLPARIEDPFVRFAHVSLQFTDSRCRRRRWACGWHRFLRCCARPATTYGPSPG